MPAENGRCLLQQQQQAEIRNKQTKKEKEGRKEMTAEEEVGVVKAQLLLQGTIGSEEDEGSEGCLLMMAQPTAAAAAVVALSATAALEPLPPLSPQRTALDAALRLSSSSAAAAADGCCFLPQRAWAVHSSAGVPCVPPADPTLCFFAAAPARVCDRLARGCALDAACLCGSPAHGGLSRVDLSASAALRDYFFGGRKAMAKKKKTKCWLAVGAIRGRDAWDAPKAQNGGGRRRERKTTTMMGGSSSLIVCGCDGDGRSDNGDGNGDAAAVVTLGVRDPAMIRPLFLVLVEIQQQQVPSSPSKVETSLPSPSLLFRVETPPMHACFDPHFVVVSSQQQPTTAPLGSDQQSALLSALDSFVRAEAARLACPARLVWGFLDEDISSSGSGGRGSGAAAVQLHVFASERPLPEVRDPRIRARFADIRTLQAFAAAQGVVLPASSYLHSSVSPDALASSLEKLFESLERVDWEAA